MTLTSCLSYTTLVVKICQEVSRVAACPRRGVPNDRVSHGADKQPLIDIKRNKATLNKPVPQFHPSGPSRNPAPCRLRKAKEHFYEVISHFATKWRMPVADTSWLEQCVITARWQVQYISYLTHHTFRKLHQHQCSFFWRSIHSPPTSVASV